MIERPEPDIASLSLLVSAVEHKEKNILHSPAIRVLAPRFLVVFLKWN